MARRLIALASVAALFVVLTVPAASAGAPEVFADEVFDWTDQLNKSLTKECGFEVFDSGYETLVVKGFFDRDGNLLKEEVHFKGTTWTYKDGGQPLIDRYAIHVTDDYVTETSTVRGNWWNVHLHGSGSGVVANESGLITFDWGDGSVIKAAGPKLEDGWAQDFCDALEAS